MQSKIPKQYLLLNGIPVIVRTIRQFINSFPDIEVIVSCSQSDTVQFEKIRNRFLKKANIQIAKGGATRFHSVKSALSKIKSDGVVGVHDAVRPFVSEQLIQNTFLAAEKFDAVIPCCELIDSIRELKKDKNNSVSRNNYRIVQTPQCFKVSVIKKAYKQKFDSAFTDDASVVEKTGVKIELIEGETTNIKLTTPTDLKLAAIILSEKN